MICASEREVDDGSMVMEFGGDDVLATWWPYAKFKLQAIISWHEERKRRIGVNVGISILSGGSRHLTLISRSFMNVFTTALVKK